MANLTPRKFQRKDHVGAYLRQELRNMVDPPRGRPDPRLSPLRVLSDSDLADIFVRMVTKRQSDETIMKSLQGRLGRGNVARVRKALYYFRSQCQPILMRVKSAQGYRGNKPLQKKVSEAEKRYEQLTEGVDALQTMYEQLKELKKRMYGKLRREQQSSWVLNAADKTIDQVTALTKQIVEFEMKLGFRQVVPSEVQVNHSHKIDAYIRQEIEGRGIGVNVYADATKAFMEKLDGVLQDRQPLPPPPMDVEVLDG